MDSGLNFHSLNKNKLLTLPTGSLYIQVVVFTKSDKRRALAALLPKLRKRVSFLLKTNMYMKIIAKDHFGLKYN